MRIVFFGPPGSGKGTQACLASAHFGLVHLSTGSLFREEVQKETDLGLRIREIMESGSLISDEIVNEQVFSKISCIEEFLLDGYPRNVSQAGNLDLHLTEIGRPLTGALQLIVPDGEVIARLSDRLTCTGCGQISDANSEPDLGRNCSACGNPLAIREDDRPEVIRERLEHYRMETRPLVDYYSGRMLEIDGLGTVQEVFTRIRESLSTWL
jgi:adenylate kinase